MVEQFDDLIETRSSSSSPPTGEGVVIDIGTGDGLFVYQSARQNPRKFYIGIDANPRPLKKVSEKIHRKPAKGGLKNALFVQAAIEDLPSELDNVADEVHIHFPWGSLLRVIATGDETALRHLRRICTPGAIIEIVIGLDANRDRSEIDRLGLQHISVDYLDSEVGPRYQAAGFDILERGVLPQSNSSLPHTSWAKRLRGSSSRVIFYITARAMGD